MIELCTTGAQIVMDRIKQFLASAAGVYLWSLVTSMVGILILFVFLSMVLSSSVTLMILPLLIGFNSAGAGYGLVSRFEGNYPNRIPALISLALLLTLFGCLSVVVFCPWEPLFDLNRWLLSAAAAVISIFVGHWIALKSQKINRSL